MHHNSPSDICWLLSESPGEEAVWIPTVMAELACDWFHSLYKQLCKSWRVLATVHTEPLGPEGWVGGWVGPKVLSSSLPRCTGCLLMAKSTKRRSCGSRLQVPLFLFQKTQHRCFRPPLPLSILAESTRAHCYSPDIIIIIVIRQ